MKPVIELDGSRFKTLEEFYDHFEERALDCSWGKNLDAFNDVLRGGFGTPEKGFKLLWGEHETSKENLGYGETVRQLRRRLANCHFSSVPSIEHELKDAMAGKGPTVFDWLVEIIRDHGPGALRRTMGSTLSWPSKSPKDFFRRVISIPPFTAHGT